jgi:hypothetical protein
MSDDLRHVSPAFLKLHQDMEGISRSLKPQYVDFYDQIERALEPIRQQHLAFTQAATPVDLASSRAVEIMKANQHWQDMIDKATASTRVFADLTRTHESWLKSIKPMQDQIAQLQAQTKLSLGGMAHRLTVSERLLAGIDFDKIRQAMLPQESAVARLQDVIRGMAANYGSLADSIRSYPDFTHLPPYALPGATREVFVTGYAVDILQAPTDEEAEDDASQLVVEAEEETSICVSLLQKVNPALATPYAGARAALGSDNPDRARHILTSLREFWNHLLRQIAPDDQVLAWVPQGETDLLHEGRPTRWARVLYVCRDLNHAPLSDFVVQDTRALVKLVEFFNRVHQLESELTDEQLRALLLRTDSWLTYILNIWEGSK